MNNSKERGRKSKAEPTPPPSFSQSSILARLSGAGDLVDVRFKANEKMKGASQIYLMDESTGKIATVAAVPKIGRLMTQNPKSGNYAFILFVNPDDSIKSGSLVTLIAGNYKKEHIKVQ